MSAAQLNAGATTAVDLDEQRDDAIFHLQALTSFLSANSGGVGLPFEECEPQMHEGLLSLICFLAERAYAAQAPRGAA